MSRAPGSYAGLTVMQADLLSFLRSEAEQDRTPSFDEMVDALSLSSKSGVHRLLAALEERGYVERRKNRARSLIVFDEPQRSGLTLAGATLVDLLTELDRRGLRVSVA